MNPVSCVLIQLQASVFSFSQFKQYKTQKHMKNDTCAYKRANLKSWLLKIWF